MKPLLRILATISLTLWLPVSASGAVLVDDSWSDGTRDDTTLPEESAWFASATGTPAVPTLSAAAGSLTGNVRMFETNLASRLWITHFAPAGNPVTLGPGDALKITLSFTPNNLPATAPTSRGLRFGLFNFSEPGAAQVSADGFSTGAGTGAPGANVTGYILNMNFAQTLINNPLQIMKRTDLPTNNLMGASAVFTALGSGGNPTNGGGFRSGAQYTFEFSARRLEAATEITTKFSDDVGWAISHTVADATNPTFSFDGLAIRPNGVADTADSFTFARFKAETIPYALRLTSLRFDEIEGVILTWDSRPGISYRVEWRAGFAEDTPWTTLETVAAAGLSTSVTDFLGVFEVQRFYRVVEEPPVAGH
jgi:hypothetical protein